MAAIKRGGALWVFVRVKWCSNAASMRVNMDMGTPAGGVTNIALTIQDDLHKCQFNMTQMFVNRIAPRVFA
jgi:hypothetical protein